MQVFWGDEMALDRIHLRKLLAIMFLNANKQRAYILEDIRDEKARDEGRASSGGDFYAPFWSDARSHVFGSADLHQMVNERIAANYRRRNLYPLLRDGFLTWWSNRRRWTNEPFRPGPTLKSQFFFPSLSATVKVENFLSVRDGLNAEYAVYPYFSPDPVLNDEAARLGLWLITMAMPSVPSDQIRILDVIRGQSFSLDRYPLNGNEGAMFSLRYERLLEYRMRLSAERD